MRLWLARHAQPLVGAGICYGQLDMPADPLATRQCAERLAQALPRETTIFSSPLQRCEQLRKELCGLRTDLASKTIPGLQEMAFGAWEGLAWSAIGKPDIDAWTADFAHYRAGLTGESVSQFMDRVAAALDTLDRAAPGHTLWLTHAGVIRAATLLAAGTRQVSHASEWPTAGPAFGQWVTLAL